MNGPYEQSGRPLSPNFGSVQVLSSAPVSVATSRFYFDSTLTQFGVYYNGIWNYPASGGAGAITSVFGRTGVITAVSGDYTFAQIGSTPTTILGYGITDPIVLTSGSYSNPSWITGLAWSKVSSTPTTVAGYGITDAATLTTTQTLSGKTLTAPIISTISNTGTLTLPVSTDTLVGRATTDTFTNKTFDSAGTGNVFRINGTAISAVTGTGSNVLSTSPTLTTPVIATITNTGTLTLPTSTDTLVGRATTDTLTNKTFDTAGAGNSFKINGVSVTAVTGTGSNVLATSPTLVTPTLGVATATSVNKLTLTAPTTSATLTLVDGSSLVTAGAFSTTLTATGATTVTLPTTGTLYGTASGSITSAQLATSLTDETGTGSIVLSASPTFTGAPLSPTAALLTNTTQIATTAYVLANAAEILLASGSVTNAATMDVNFTTWFNAYTYLEVVFYKMVPLTNTANLTMVVSTDAVTYDTSAASYQYTYSYINTGATPGASGSTSAANMQVTTSSGTTANYTINGIVRLYNTGSATSFFSQSGQLVGVASDGTLAGYTFGGFRIAQQVTKAIRFLFSTGNITGSWKIYGHN